MLVVIVTCYPNTMLGTRGLSPTYHLPLLLTLGPLGCPEQCPPDAEMASNSGQATRLLQGNRFQPCLPRDALVGSFEHDPCRNSRKVCNGSGSSMFHLAKHAGGCSTPCLYSVSGVLLPDDQSHTHEQDDTHASKLYWFSHFRRFLWHVCAVRTYEEGK